MIQEIQSIELSGLSFSFGQEEKIFDRVDLQIPAGKVINVTSDESASGKSTLLKVLAGLLDPTEGTYTINKMDINEMSFEEFLPYRLNIGYGFDSGGLINNQSIYSNLCLPLEYHSLCEASEIEQRVNKLVDLFGLGEVKDHRPSAVSGSKRKAACVARSLVLNPHVLLLDEPTTGLGQEYVESLKDLIKTRIQTKELQFVVVITHSANFCSGLVDLEIKISNKKLSINNYEDSSLGSVA